MSNIAKTGVFGGVALLSAVLAFAFQGNRGEYRPPEEVGKKMFPEFVDPLAAKSLSITRFDEALADLRQIEVKEINGVWGLPSHEGYPADAENRIRDATTPFIDLDVIRVASDSESTHSEFGVKEPNAESSKAGDEGVGTKVVIKDGGGKPLVDLIIGKEVKDQEGQRYARRTGKPRVYVIKIDPDSLPAKFENWIEDDLLKTSSFNIDQLSLKDYSFDVERTLAGPQTDFEERLQISLSYKDNEWNLDQMLENRNGQLIESKLLDTEELAKDRLNSLRDAIAELKIVSVEKKPDGLTSDLKAGDGFFEDQQGVNSLMSRGFYPVQLNGKVELLSTDGEVLASTKDGVEYVLRFGKVQGIDTEGGEGKINRFLLVSARVNDSKFPAPELEEIPALSTEGDATLDPSAESTGDDAESTAVDSSGTDQVQDDTVEDDTVQDDTVQDEKANADCGQDVDADAASTSEIATEEETSETATAETATAETATAETATGEEATGEEATGEANADVESDEATTGGPAKDDSDKSTDSVAEIQAERERITKENNRKLDEHKEKLKKAQDQVHELNYRFADWYYVISDDVYKKIHLSRADIIKENEAAKEAGTGLDALDKLKTEGLKRSDDE